MSPEKARTLQLLKDGMGHEVEIQSEGFAANPRPGSAPYSIHAQVYDCDSQDLLPIAFLISSVSFLEAGKVPPGDPDGVEYQAEDGWTVHDFVACLKIEPSGIRMDLGVIRGREVYTTVWLSAEGGLRVDTAGRADCARKWISYVQGRTPSETTASQSLRN